MRYLILIVSLAILCLSSCKDDDLFVELDYSYYDPGYVGGNPISIDSTEYFQVFIYDQFGNLIEVQNKAYIYFDFDESVLENSGQNYFLSLSGSGAYAPDSEGNVRVTRWVDPNISDYCSEVQFLDAVLNPVHTYTMCYTIEY